MLASENRSEAMADTQGVVIGCVVKIEANQLFVVFPGNKSKQGIAARSVVSTDRCGIGCEVALSFEGGDPARPIVLGKLVRPDDHGADDSRLEACVSLPETIDLTGQRNVTLRCGKASITLTKEGKIILRGTYISSRSSGPNRIKGGSVHLN